MKCDLCDNPAVVHETTLKNGVKNEVHLCQEHAAEAGIAMPGAPIQDLLLNVPGPTASPPATVKAVKKACPTCGLSFAKFRQKGIVGCPACYQTFQRHLAPLIERAQGGATQHVGKAPRRSGVQIDRKLQIQQLLKELDDAVAAEQYERAATLRDRIDTLKQECT